jgi:ribosomal protein L11 methyltransferase
VTTPYLRYTLRLQPAAGQDEGLIRPAAGEPDDDWSGAAAFAWHADPAALHYVHPEAVALITALQPSGWQEEDDGHTLAFWLTPEAAAQPEATAKLAALAALGELEATPEAAGWDEAWKAFHRPHVVGRLFLRPPWYPPRPGLLDVVVDAGQAFGTGGHETTRECIALLGQIAPGSLLDIGCGSGVVALAALRLGFGPVWGVDIDPAAVTGADENAARNGLTPEFRVADAGDPAVPLPAADVVVANIALQPILRLAARFASAADHEAALRPRDLVLAGLLCEHGPVAAAAFPAYRVVGELQEGEWLALHLARRS